MPTAHDITLYFLSKAAKQEVHTEFFFFFLNEELAGSSLHVQHDISKFTSIVFSMRFHIIYTQVFFPLFLLFSQVLSAWAPLQLL